MRRRFRHFGLSLAILGSMLIAAHESPAAIVLAHQGMSDPATEGFHGISAAGGASTTFSRTNDLGKDAWEVLGSSLASQYVYSSGPLSDALKSDIDNHGFLLNGTFRVEQGIAPLYTPSSPIAIGFANIYVDGRRYEMSVGLDPEGHEVVILPDALDNGGPGHSIRVMGQSYSLPDAGYHNYSLSYDPISKTAELFVDGVERIQGYHGYSAGFVTDDGLHFGAMSGGGANFNVVTLSIVPEVGPITFLIAPLLVLGGCLSVRRRAPVNPNLNA